MADYTGVDFLALDEVHFSDEERVARDAVRDWVGKEFLPRLQEHVRQDGSFPMELVPQIAELGHVRRQPEGLRVRGHEPTSRTGC